MSALRVAVLGSGQVAQTLAQGFRKHGHSVVMGNRDTAKLAEFSTKSGIDVLGLEESVEDAELVILAVKGTAAEAVATRLSKQLAGKVVIDTTNPIADAPPDHGVLAYFTDGSASLMERLQAIAPEARFVKAFNSVGSAFMVNPPFPGGKPSMFIAGNDAEAKAIVGKVLDSFGWETEDMGSAASARPIEALCQLWCARGFVHNQWAHAFKLLKA